MCGGAAHNFTGGLTLSAAELNVGSKKFVCGEGGRLVEFQYCWNGISWVVLGGGVSPVRVCQNKGGGAAGGCGCGCGGAAAAAAAAGAFALYRSQHQQRCRGCSYAATRHWPQQLGAMLQASAPKRLHLCSASAGSLSAVVHMRSLRAAPAPFPLPAALVEHNATNSRQ